MAVGDLLRKAGAMDVPQDDGADHLRADILGSIVGSDPRLPNYLGRINSLITAHGTVGKPSSETGMKPPEPGMAVPGGDPGAASSTAPTPTATPDSTAPLMGAAPKPSLLGKIGHVAARMGNIAGDILAPRTTSLIPGSDLYKERKAKEAEALKERQQRLATEETRAGAEKTTAETRAKLEPSEAAKNLAEAAAAGKGKTPDEATFNDLLTGDNGKARINPETKQPYTPLEAFKEVQQTKAAGKPDTETQEAQRYEGLVQKQKLKQPVTPEDQAWAQAYEKRKTLAPFAGAAAQAPEKGTERMDRSYQFNSGQLEKVRQPIDQLAGRMSNLVSNVNFQTPQADALLAPEILSLQAGGAGSGLRMNEAEISRIIGGATKWTQLQTALNKWSTDPAHATFTNDQRKQMRQIIQAAQAKLSAKQTILEQGEQDLIDAADVTEHRRIVANTRKLLDAVDSGKKVIRKDGKIQIGE